MQLVVKGKNMEVSERLRKFVETKLSRIQRVLPGIAEAEVEFSNAKTRSADNRYVVQVTLKTNRTMIRGEQAADDTYTAMDAVLEKIDRQVSRFKTKRSPREARGAAEPELEMEDIEPADEGEGHLVRVKRFIMKPMDVEEALDQMQLLGHDFYVFLNSETDNVSVVYRRQDGNFGLIEPETSRT